MAVVGNAYILVRAVTTQVRDDIRNGMRGVPDLFDQAGRDSGRKFSGGFNKGGGGKGIFGDLKNESEAAREKLTGLITTGYAVTPAIVGIVGAVGSAGSALFALGAQAASAGPALLSLVNVFTAVAQAAVVFKIAVSGVGAAISAGLNQKGGGKSAKDKAKEIENAKKRVEDAQKRLAQVQNANDQRELNATEAVNEAKKRQADLEKEILEYQAAEVEASDAVAEAKSRVADAVDEATESIQQLRFELEEAVLSEQRAALNFEDAREELAKVSNLPPNNRQRREAELAFAEADLRLRRAKDATSDTAKEVDKANEKGIEGSEQVVAARQRVTDAEKAYTKAQEATTKAKNRAEEATKAVEKAENELNAVRLENLAREAEAQEAVDEALDNLEDVKKGTNDAAGGVDKFAQAMAKLSPSAQEFVNYIISMKDEFSKLKKETQEAFFSEINDDIKDLVDTYLPLLNKNLPETARVLAGVGEKLIGVFNKPENVAIIDRVFGSNNQIIDDLGTAVSNLASTFLILLDAARPLAEKLAEWVKNLTDGWKESIEADAKSGKLAKTLNYAWKVAKDLKDIFADLIGAIKNIGIAAAGPGSGGEMLLGWIKDAVARWKEFTGSEEGQSRLEKFFQNVAPVAREMFRILGRIIKAIFETTEAGVDPGKGAPLLRFFESIGRAVDKFVSIGPELNSVLPIVGKGLEAAAGAIANLTSSGAIESFFGVLTRFAEFAQDLTSNPVFQKIFGIVAPIFAIGRGLSLILSFAKFLFLGAIIGNIFQFVSMFSTLAGLFGSGGALAGIGASIGGAISAAAAPVAIVVAIIAGLIALFVGFWNESEKFREGIKKYVSEVTAKISEVFNMLKEKIDSALEPIGGLEGAMNNLKTVFRVVGDIIGQYVLPVITWLVTTFWNNLGNAIGFIIDIIGFLIRAFIAYKNAVETVWNAVYGAIETVVNWFKSTVWPVIETAINNIKGAFEAVFNVAKTVWDGIYGAIKAAVDFIWSIVWPIISTFIETTKLGFSILWNVVKEKFEEIRKKIEAVFTAVRDVLAPIITGALDKIKEAINTAKEFITEKFDAVKNKVSDVFTNIRDFLAPIFTAAIDKIKDTLQPLLDKVNEIFNAIKSKVDGVSGGIKTATSGLWDGITTGLSSALQGVKNFINPFGAGVNKLIRGFNALPGDDLPTLPEPLFAAKGATVFPKRGGTLAVVAEAGRAERIEPLDPDGLSKRDKAMISYLTGGAGGATINVYPSEGMNERELAQMVSKELAYMMRKGGI